MKNKTKSTRSVARVITPVRSIRPLVQQVRALVQSARRAAASSFDTLQVLTNFEIGRLIVEHEQHGKQRAGYGKEVIKALSERLTIELGRGFSETNLASMRTFFLVYRERSPIFQSVTGKLPQSNILQ